MIHWEMCKKFKFDHTNIWYMHNPAAVLENDTHKFLWDFDIQTNHLISARRPDLIVTNKKKKKKKKEKKKEKKKRTCKIVDFVVPADHRIKVKGAFGTVTKGLLKGLEDLEVGGRVETIQS